MENRGVGIKLLTPSAKVTNWAVACHQDRWGEEFFIIPDGAVLFEIVNDILSGFPVYEGEK